MEEQLIRQLKREASMHGMCRENRLALDSVSTMDEAIELYKKTIDWALEENYPSLLTLRRYFPNCAEQGVFVDREFRGELLYDMPVYVFHDCSGVIRTGLNVSKRIIPMLYFANGCDMTIKYEGPQGIHTYIPLYVFGENNIRAKDSASAVFRFYKFDVK